MSTLVSASVRVRWAAIGAAIAVTLGGGALGVVQATSSSGERAVFVAITPCRLFDTRADQAVGLRNVPLGGADTFTAQVRGQNGNCNVPPDAVAVAMNVTAVNGTAASFLTIWPADAPKPLASSLNWTAGAAPTPNKVDVKLSATGAISLYNNGGNVDVLADVVGYYVDHNHDDRYYTKAELDDRTVRLSVDPLSMRGIGPAPYLSSLDNCVAVASDSVGSLPLDLPVGARLLNVDIVFWDGSTSTIYRAFVDRFSPSQSGLGFERIASTNGGSGSGSFGPVKHHLTPANPTTVAEGEKFEIEFSGILNPNNGVCTVTVEYDPAP